MHTFRSLVTAAVLIPGTTVLVGQSSRVEGTEVIFDARVGTVYGPSLFTVTGTDIFGDSTVLVFSPGVNVPVLAHDTVLVAGIVEPFDPARLYARYSWRPPPALPAAARDLPFVVASTVTRPATATAPGAAVTAPIEQEPLLAPLVEQSATQVHLSTLVQHMFTLGGRLVRVPRLNVTGILSPRAFIVQGRGRPEARALVLAPGPLAAPLAAGSEVEVVGRAYTLAGARAQPSWPSGLTGSAADALQRFEDGPILLIESVRTPGGVVLYDSPGSR